MEVIETERATEFVAVVREASFLIKLVTLGKLGELKKFGSCPICVKHFERVKLAVAVDHSEHPIICDIPVDRQIGIIDIALEAKLAQSEIPERVRCTTEGRIAKSVGRARRGWVSE